MSAAAGRIQDRYGGDQDESLVRGWIKAIAEGEINQRGKHQDRCEGDGVRRSYSHSRFSRDKAPDLCVGSGHQAQDDHQTSQAEAHQPQAAMHIHAAGGGQGCLHDQEEDPAGKQFPLEFS